MQESSCRHAVQQAFAGTMSHVHVAFENRVLVKQLQIPPCVAVCTVGCVVRS